LSCFELDGKWSKGFCCLFILNKKIKERKVFLLERGCWRRLVVLGKERLSHAGLFCLFTKKGKVEGEKSKVESGK